MRQSDRGERQSNTLPDNTYVLDLDRIKMGSAAGSLQQAHVSPNTAACQQPSWLAGYMYSSPAAPSFQVGDE